MKILTQKQILPAFILLTNLLILLNINQVLAAKAPSGVMQQLAENRPIDLIVEYDDAEIEKIALSMRNKKYNRADDETIIRYKVEQYRTLKNKIDQSIIRSDIQHIESYSHIPMSFKRFDNQSSLNAFLGIPGIKAVYLNEKLHRVLAESLKLIEQDTVAISGINNVSYLGSGTTVAVIDDGIDFNHAAFGSCTAPNSSSSCRVVVSNTFAATSSTNNNHGTNVSAIVLGVAPESKIAALNVFDSTGYASAADVISAINWTISNRATYNIVAINMSLGGDTKFTSTCKNDWSSTPVTRAKNAGISVAVAAGNSQFIDGLSSPACAPSAISVGAVYDKDIGAITWGTSPNCTDNITLTNKVTCFSNSANYLTLLAPGALINAGGSSYGGTSQASPHVAGAIAVLRAAFPNETLAQTQARITNTGVLIADSRNNLTKPSLNLLAAARPINDAFVNRISISGISGSASGVSLLATKEINEPIHINNLGGSSIWWKWTAPSSGQVSINTIGSGFDTLLGIYTGNIISALNRVAANDNDINVSSSSLEFQAVADTEYQFVVDGAANDNSAGVVLLNWNLNVNAQANLSSSVLGPTNVVLGSPNSYTLTVSSAGPQSATNVVAMLSIPVGASFVSASSECSINGNMVSCLAGTLASDSTQSFVIQLIWNVVSTSTSLSASVSSDLPDSNNTNDISTIQIALGGIDSIAVDAEIPTLPEWGMLLMAITLIFTSLHTRNRS